MFGFWGGGQVVKENCNSTSAGTPLKIVQLWRGGGLVFAGLLKFVVTFSGLASLIFPWYECSHCEISLNTPA